MHSAEAAREREYGERATVASERQRVGLPGEALDVVGPPAPSCTASRLSGGGETSPVSFRICGGVIGSTATTPPRSKINALRRIPEEHREVPESTTNTSS